MFGLLAPMAALPRSGGNVSILRERGKKSIHPWFDVIDLHRTITSRAGSSPELDRALPGFWL
jgi:alkylated DNA nucleotide flippase Atl1